MEVYEITPGPELNTQQENNAKQENNEKKVLSKATQIYGQHLRATKDDVRPLGCTIPIFA